MFQKPTSMNDDIEESFSTIELLQFQSQAGRKKVSRKNDPRNEISRDISMSFEKNFHIESLWHEHESKSWFNSHFSSFFVDPLSGSRALLLFRKVNLATAQFFLPCSQFLWFAIRFGDFGESAILGNSTKLLFISQQHHKFPLDSSLQLNVSCLILYIAFLHVYLKNFSFYRRKNK